MVKQNPNDKCHCNSDKKYKKCCMINDFKLKQNEELTYLNGQITSSEKVKFCINHYQPLFDKHKIIDITNNLNQDNYKTYHIKNYNNKTIMIAEKTEKNIDLFLEKSNLDSDDIIIMYRGAYKIFNLLDILKYDEDIVRIIEKRDNGEPI